MITLLYSLCGAVFATAFFYLIFLMASYL